MNKKFIKKYWEEENILFYLHFENGNTVRQIEITPDTKILTSEDNHIQGDSFLYDQSLDELDLDPHDFISEDIFNKVWESISIISYIEYGSIFRVKGVFNYAHGCNCAGAMGKGIAIQFKEMFPTMYKQYKEMCLSGKFTLGEVFVFNYGDGYVFNLATQKTWKTKADIDAVKITILKMLEFASDHKIESIALPKIAAGLGGLDWEIVKQIIEYSAYFFPEVNLIIVENYRV